MEENVVKKAKWWEILLAILAVLIFLFIVFLAYGSWVDNCWYKLLVINNDSMSPTLKAGDLICITPADSAKLKPGDIISFATRDGEIITHRIVEIKADGEIVTQGDANNAPDTWQDGWKLKSAGGVYAFKISGLGYAMNWFGGKDSGANFKDKTRSENNEIKGWEPTPVPESTHPPLQAPVPGEPTDPSGSISPEPSASPSDQPEVSPSESTDPNEETQPSSSPDSSPSESTEPSSSPQPSQSVIPSNSAEPGSSSNPTESYSPELSIEPNESNESLTSDST